MMKKNQRRLLVRALAAEGSEHELSGRERRRLALLLERSGEARVELDGMRRLESEVRGGAFDSFAPGFADRVMLAVARPLRVPADRIADLLPRLFARVVPAALALAGIIAGYNAVSGGAPDRSAVETIFGIPRFSVTAAYEAALVGGDDPAGPGGATP